MNFCVTVSAAGFTMSLHVTGAEGIPVSVCWLCVYSGTGGCSSRTALASGSVTLTPFFHLLCSQLWGFGSGPFCFSL